MRRIAIIFFFTLCSVLVSAQDMESRPITFQNLGIEKPRFGWELTKFDFQPVLDFSEFNQYINPLEEGIELKSPDFYPKKITSFTFPHNNFLNKYDFFGKAQNDYRLNKNSWINLANYHTGYWGFGVTNTVSGTYYHQLNDRLVLSAGIHAGKSTMFDYYGNNAGVNGGLKYLLSDRINLNFSAGYSIANTQSFRFSSTYQGISLGGSMEIKISEKFSLIAGVQYDVAEKKWLVVIMPKINTSLADLLSLNKKKKQQALIQRNALIAYDF